MQLVGRPDGVGGKEGASSSIPTPLTGMCLSLTSLQSGHRRCTCSSQGLGAGRLAEGRGEDGKGECWHILHTRMWMDGAVKKGFV